MLVSHALNSTYSCHFKQNLQRVVSDVCTGYIYTPVFVLDQIRADDLSLSAPDTKYYDIVISRSQQQHTLVCLCAADLRSTKMV